MKQLEVQIMGHGYLLGCPEGGEAKLMAAVNRVDTAMCKIRDGGKIKARDRIAVLAALNLAFDANANANTSANEGDSNPEMADPVELTLNRRQSDVLLEPLLRRLDKVLGDDGKLF
jgi:cell division protein ZapA